MVEGSSTTDEDSAVAVRGVRRRAGRRSPDAGNRRGRRASAWPAGGRHSPVRPSASKGSAASEGSARPVRRVVKPPRRGLPAATNAWPRRPETATDRRFAVHVLHVTGRMSGPEGRGAARGRTGARIPARPPPVGPGRRPHRTGGVVDRDRSGMRQPRISLAPRIRRHLAPGRHRGRPLGSVPPSTVPARPAAQPRRVDGRPPPGGRSTRSAPGPSSRTRRPVDPSPGGRSPTTTTARAVRDVVDLIAGPAGGRAATPPARDGPPVAGPHGPSWGGSADVW